MLDHGGPVTSLLLPQDRSDRVYKRQRVPKTNITGPNPTVTSFILLKQSTRRRLQHGLKMASIADESREQERLLGIPTQKQDHPHIARNLISGQCQTSGSIVSYQLLY